MHTTASDGRLTPAELVARAAAAGLTTISVTDHDTVAAIADVDGGGAAAGIRVIPGIEITAVDRRHATCTCSATSSIRRARRCRRCS